MAYDSALLTNVDKEGINKDGDKTASIPNGNFCLVAQAIRKLMQEGE